MNRRPVNRLEAFFHALAAVVLRSPKGRHHQPTAPPSAGEDTAPIRGYLYLRCDGCGEIITCIDAGSSLAGLNAEAAAHTCPTGEAASNG